jgi:hypothetical protein
MFQTPLNNLIDAIIRALQDGIIIKRSAFRVYNPELIQLVEQPARVNRGMKIVRIQANRVLLSIVDEIALSEQIICWLVLLNFHPLKITRTVLPFSMRIPIEIELFYPFILA